MSVLTNRVAEGINKIMESVARPPLTREPEKMTTFACNSFSILYDNMVYALLIYKQCAVYLYILYTVYVIECFLYR